LNIVHFRQLGNTLNDYDGNKFEDAYFYYNNNNSYEGRDTFMGGAVSFQNCLMVFNWNRLPSSTVYQLKRYEIAIEYDPTVQEKRTFFHLDRSFYTTASFTGFNDIPCAQQEIYFHPGINGILYRMDDQHTYIFKVDISNAGVENFCQAELFNSTVGNYLIDFSDLPSGGFSVLEHKEPVFINKTFFLPVVGEISGAIRSRLYRIDLEIQSPTLMTSEKTLATDVEGEFTKIYAFEEVGFVYTLKGRDGYYLARLNRDTFKTVESTGHFGSTVEWHLYQTRAENHMYRPVWGVNATHKSTVNRITTTFAQKIHDDTLTTNFFDFELHFARFRAMAVMPGLCSESRDSLDYNK